MMTALAIALSKNKNTAIVESDLALALDEVAEAIKNYCNISIIPEALNYVWANMALELAEYQHQKYLDTSAITIEPDPSDIDSVKVGDTQVSVKGGGVIGIRGKILSAHRLDLDGIVLNYTQALQKFRKVVW